MPQAHDVETNHWLAVCRKHVRQTGFIKVAELGGDGQDAPFEQSFSNLAHAYLRDKAPTLLDHELGFQLVDRNQDNTKAVGVFAFKVGSQRLFAPVFFLKGDLKGHELLYMRNQDMFVPLKENWLNYILNRKPNILGSGVSRQTSQLGVRQPSLNALSQSPYKYAEVRVKTAFSLFGGKGKTHEPVNEVGVGDQVDPDSVIFASYADEHGKNQYVPIGNPNWSDEETPDRLSRHGLTHYQPMHEDAYQGFLKKLQDNLAIQKTASSRFNPAVRPFMPIYAHLATASLNKELEEFATHCQERLDLGHFLKQASLPALEAAVTLMQQRPAIAKAFDTWHGMHTLSDAVKQASDRMTVRSVLDNPYAAVNRNQRYNTGSVLTKTAADSDNGPDYKQKVKIVTWDSSTTDKLPEGLTEEDQEKLVKDTVLIKDERKSEEVSVPVNVQVEQRLSNPTETGIYQVLVKLNGFEKCLVVVGPHGPDGRTTMATVVRLDDSTRNWGNFQTSEIWVAGQDESLSLGGDESWNDWFDSISDASLPSEDNYSNQYMAIGPRRNATCPFRVRTEIGNDDGVKSYDVDFSYEFSQYRPGRRTSIIQTTDQYDRYNDGQRLHLDSKDGTDLRSAHGDLFVPKGYKIMKLQPSKADDLDAAETSSIRACCDYDSGSSNPPAIQPGNLLDANMYIMKKTAAMKIAYDGVGYHINDGDSLRLNDALINLVMEHGLRETSGRQLLKQAAAAKQSGQSFKCRIKHASPFLTEGGPTAPAINDDQSRGGYNPMGWPGQTQTTYTQDIPIPEMSAANTDRNIYNVNPSNTPEPMDANGVNQAAQTGQREVFDTAMIGSMLKAVRDDTMIDRYLPDLIKGVDRLGRILFMFYWHQDKFADRYGKQDMPELEDSLRNAFEMIGDVVLFLKQKTVEPYPEEDVRDIDLGPAANS